MFLSVSLCRDSDGGDSGSGGPSRAFPLPFPSLRAYEYPCDTVMYNTLYNI